MSFRTRSPWIKNRCSCRTSRFSRSPILLFSSGASHDMPSKLRFANRQYIDSLLFIGLRRRDRGDQVPGSELLAIANSTVRYETRLCLLLVSCGRAPIVTPRRSKTSVSRANRVRHYETVLVVETAQDSSEIFDGIILVSYRTDEPGSARKSFALEPSSIEDKETKKTNRERFSKTLKRS